MGRGERNAERTGSIKIHPGLNPLDDDGRRHAAGGAHGHEATLEVTRSSSSRTVPIRMAPVAPMDANQGIKARTSAVRDM